MPAGLELNDGHSKGPVSLGYQLQKEKTFIISCGADGKVYSRAVDTLDVQHSFQGENGAFNQVALDSKTGLLAVADEQYVKVLKPGRLELERNATRFNLPVRALAISPDGSTLAAAGDSENIKLVNAREGVVLRNLRNEGYVRCVAFDPEGTFVAAAQASGAVTIYDVKTGKQEWQKTIAPKVDPTSDYRCGLSWHPDGGSLLAVPGTDNDVVLYERLCWEPTQYLRGGHSAHVNVFKFSPNGLYAASAGLDKVICIWDMGKMEVLASITLECVASDFAWHPSLNQLAVGTEDGRLGVWHSPVPEGLPGPAVTQEELMRLQKEEEAAAEAQATAVVEDQEFSFQQQAGSLSLAGLVEPNLAPEAEGQEASDIGPVSGRKTVMPNVRPQAQVVRQIVKVVEKAATGPPPQPALQPGSTTAGGDKPRFLAYNLLGCIISRPIDDYATIEVTFHDTHRHTYRPPLLTDLYGFDKGALCEHGMLLSSRPNKRERTPSMLVYRPFEHWAPNSDWLVALPEGEEVVCLAASASFMAVATSMQHLRLFTPAGLQTAVINLPGPAVCLAASEAFLAVAYHASSPDMVTNNQNIHFMVYDVPAKGVVSTPLQLPLSKGSTLTWFGFSEDGLLSSMDSDGVLRVRGLDFGGCWMPLFDSRSERKADEVFWPVAVTSAELLSIVCPKSQPEPQVNPRPYYTPQPLRAPLLTMDNSNALALEQELLRCQQQLQMMRKQLELVGGASAPVEYHNAVVVAETDVDKALLTLLSTILKSARWARALEAAAQLHSYKSLEGALKLANHFRALPLAERITQLMEERLLAEHQGNGLVTPLQQQHQTGLHSFAAEPQQPQQTHVETDMEGDGKDVQAQATTDMVAVGHLEADDEGRHVSHAAKGGADVFGKVKNAFSMPADAGKGKAHTNQMSGVTASIPHGGSIKDSTSQGVSILPKLSGKGSNSSQDLGAADNKRKATAAVGNPFMRKDKVAKVTKP